MVPAHVDGIRAASEALPVLGWSARLEVALPLAGMAGLYALGWWRLSRRARGAVAPWRPVCAAGAVASLAIALLSPLDGLADVLFSVHMLQHLLLIAVAAPALLLADPFPVALWALPRPLRRGLGRLLGRGGWLRRLGRAVTPMGAAWLSYAAILWLWHLPAAYDAALRSRLLHDLEHLLFFGSAVLFWWPVIDPAPRVRPPASFGARIVYLVLAAFQGAALGLLLTLSPRVLYATYGGAPAPWGIDPLEDQAWGGVLMWGLGSVIEMAAVLLLLMRLFGPGPRSAPARAAARAGQGWPRVG